MKILLTSPEQSSISGQPIYVKNLAKGLKELGHEVHCLEIPTGEHYDLAIVNDFYPDVLDKFSANKIYNFCHSKEAVDRPIEDERINGYLAPRQQVADHWNKNFDILPIPIDYKKFNKAKKKKTKRYTVLIPCSITQTRQAMVYNLLQRAKENPKMDFIFRATNQARFLHLAPDNVKFLPKTETLEKDMANADEVAGIFVGTVTLEAWAMGLKTSVYDENGMWDYVKPPKDFKKKHHYLNVANKLIEITQEKYSVIIPTMWVSDKIERMIKVYDKSDYIGEVIIIDNKPEDKRKIKSDKIRYISKGKNIYVNPAWNWGVKEAKYQNIIIANDDVYFNNLDDLLDKVTLKKGMMIGPYLTCYKSKEKNLTIREIPENHVNKFLTWGYGTFMIMRKDSYIQIPDDFLIWEGDIIQARNNQTFCFTGIPIETEMSETIKKYDMKSKGYEDLERRHKFPELFKLNPRDRDLMLPGVTFVIKTFKRYQCLTRLLMSIKHFYPYNNIIIVDDNDDSEFKPRFYLKWSKRLNIQLIRLPFNSGLSMGRNEAVKNTKTPFILLLDDDFEFTEETDAKKFYTIIKSDEKIGVVGGVCLANEAEQHYEFIPKLKDGVLMHEFDGDKYFKINNIKVKETGCVLNFGLFRTKLLKEIKWDDKLKLSEHIDFYLRLAKTDWKVYYTPQVRILHNRGSEGNYRKYREASELYQVMMYRKNKINKIIHLDGSVGELVGNKIKRYKIERKKLINKPTVILTGMDNVTFCITMFERWDKLKTLLFSIAKYYPTVNILIADQSKKFITNDYLNLYKELFEKGLKKKPKAINILYDSGLSYCRNKLFETAITGYILVLEEDFEFTEETKIEPMLDYLEKNNNCVGVGGQVYENGTNVVFSHFYTKRMGSLIMKTNPNEFKDGFRETQAIMNFALYRKNMPIRWDEDIKIEGEHNDFMFRLKEAGLKIVETNLSSINHNKGGDGHDYKSMRKRDDFLKILFNKHKINKLIYPNKFTIALKDGKIVKGRGKNL